MCIVKSLFLLNFFITSFMFGLILTTQIVSYPLFIRVKSYNFSVYHSDYVNRISSIVIPVMISEFFLAILLSYYSYSHLVLYNFILFLLILLTTYLFQIPIHNNIRFESNKLIFDKLINTNWIRTILWFLKSMISFAIIYREVIWILFLLVQQVELENL